MASLQHSSNEIGHLYPCFAQLMLRYTSAITSEYQILFIKSEHFLATEIIFGVSMDFWRTLKTRLLVEGII